MVKLDYDVISQAPSHWDALKDMMLDLRGLRIPQIENLAITKDTHDTIDFTDNDIRKLENFPPMKRLKTLLLSNNRISKIDPEASKNIPNLENLILSNNQMTELGDLEPLKAFTNLVRVSLIDNPVTMKKHYRSFVLHLCPKLRVLDFQKVTNQERKTSQEMFAGAEGDRLISSFTSKKSTFVPGEGMPKKESKRAQGPSPEEAAKIREAIKNATTLDEISRLKRQLEGGAMPPSAPKGVNVVEMDED
ncbi:U2 small nuclear ribonucleoprotein A' [Chytridiales sp. JEL 0842]|nr:U2 small nuclear ribonucleoprotein A' [Chytridiales sp. JEL 0842]